MQDDRVSGRDPVCSADIFRKCRDNDFGPPSIGDPRSALCSWSTRAEQSCLVTENRPLVRSNGRQTKMLEVIGEVNLIEKDAQS
jgi:hypothetical protein